MRRWTRTRSACFLAQSVEFATAYGAVERYDDYVSKANAALARLTPTNDNLEVRFFGARIFMDTVQRVGQDIFRRGLLEYWDGRCAITGLAVPDLLRASHIKPWAECERDAERLDVFNGLLLGPHPDAAFDAGFITIAEDGTVLVSDALPAGARTILGLDQPLKVRVLQPAHERYLPWHRTKIFRAPAIPSGEATP